MKILLCSILMLTLTACVTDGDEPQWSIAPGDKVPPFSVVMSDGSVFSTAGMEGHVSLLLFFNTDCPDCRAELPEIEKVFRTLPDGALLACIAREEDEASAGAWWESHNLTMPYSPQPDRSVYSLFASAGIPRIYIVSPTLTIHAAYTPEDSPTAEELLAAMDAAR